jgi:hypothetical protein
VHLPFGTDRAFVGSGQIIAAGATLTNGILLLVDKDLARKAFPHWDLYIGVSYTSMHIGSRDSFFGSCFDMMIG